jgi:hypothetical protein
MSKKGISKALEQDVAASVLLGTRRYDHREFLMELNRVGLKFVKDKVDPDDQEHFTTAFDELVGLGCRPETLASTLYSFCKSYAVLEPSSPPYGQRIYFPPDEEIRKIRDTLQSASKGIRRVDDYGILEILARYGKCIDPPEAREQVLAVLRWYIDSLPLWWVPRKDIVQSSAPIACCLYPKIVTGEFRFTQVANLLECLGYSPDPKHQTKTTDRRDKTDPCDQSLERNLRNSENAYPIFCDQSLERNFRNFRKAYPIFCDQLQADLKRDHESEENRRIEEFDHWIVEKDIPFSVFDQLRPNRFDWKIVFPHPERKRKR